MWWYVISPEYGEVVPVLDYGQGPIEYGRDVIEVQARTKKEAISAGVAMMLKVVGRQFKGVQDTVASGMCPYTGFTAEPIHGRL